MNTNNLIYLTNKVLSNKYKKEYNQYSKENSKICLVILGIINNKILTALKYKQTVKTILITLNRYLRPMA